VLALTRLNGIRVAPSARSDELGQLQAALADMVGDARLHGGWQRRASNGRCN